MAKRRGYHGGAWDAFGFMEFTAEVSRLVMAQQLKESGGYKKLGYDTWEEYCNEQLRCSDENIRKQIKALKDAGPHVLSTCRELGFGWKEIRMLTDDQGDNVKAGFLMIEDRKTPITAENADIIKLYTGNLEKSEKLASSKLSSIEKEHRKEQKAYQKELDELKALLPDREDPKWALAYMEKVKEIFDTLDLAIRHFAFDKRVFEDPMIPAKVSGIIEELRTRVRELNTNWNVACHEEWGEDV